MCIGGRVGVKGGTGGQRGGLALWAFFFYVDSFFSLFFSLASMGF